MKSVKNVETTVIDAHVLRDMANALKSPLDTLLADAKGQAAKNS